MLIFIFMIMGFLLITGIDVGKFMPLDKFMIRGELLFFPYLLIALWLGYSTGYFMTLVTGRKYPNFYHRKGKKL